MPEAVKFPAFALYKDLPLEIPESLFRLSRFLVGIAI